MRYGMLLWRFQVEISGGIFGNECANSSTMAAFRSCCHACRCTCERRFAGIEPADRGGQPAGDQPIRSAKELA